MMMRSGVDLYPKSQSMHPLVDEEEGTKFTMVDSDVNEDLSRFSIRSMENEEFQVRGRDAD
ncbi:hypothetical protein CCM_00168 [Cordyceps militaris CM01]|uniref:Uncharacterized protein n=1 Tax=Cordyceps militaris (strain CM01) TaxID=983644 RepID=G3J7P8_CORMM|nr:uncharacterized protein CCM_00168 [Cordyceps militaris CM01]EGX95514.1 hypothetical protein CCM_00168 [Cordyceps militaris CM01]